MARLSDSRNRKRTSPRKNPVLGHPVEKPIDLRNTVAFRLLGIASKLTQGFISRYTSQFGIGLPEWRTLGMMGQFGPLPSIRIAELAEMDRGAISRAVAWLEAKDLVRRIDDPTHKRRKIVALTAAGKRLHDRISALAQARQHRVLKLISPAEQETLNGIFEKLDQWADELRSRSSEPRRAAAAVTATRQGPAAPAASLVSLRREKLLAELAHFKRAIQNCP